MDPRNWSTEQIGRYLVANGDDLPGNLKIGRMALDRVRRPPLKSRREDYPELADKAIKGETPGSSAGGEQAKFTTYSRKRKTHVIVKFSPKGDSALARRWRDIIVSEYIAAKVLLANNIPAAELEIFEVGGRLFLESRRFDRVGEYGRLPLVSMQAIDNEFSGVGSGWLKVSKRLNELKLITWQNFYDIAVYWGFGRLINNTDMHLGNISFSIDGAGFSLAPIYDMCAMGFAPESMGGIPPLSFDMPEIDAPLRIFETAVPMMKEMAQMFWHKLEENNLISAELNFFLKQNNYSSKISS